MLSIIAPLLLLQSASAQSAPAPTPTPAPPARCDGEEHSQFDFWVGEWNVYPNGSDQSVGESRIEKLYNGCAIRENWMPQSGATGGSLSAFDPETGRWHQLWIGSSPGRVFFDGGAVEGKMVLTGFWKNGGGPGQDALVRMTYTANEDGSVRQHGEGSTDHGLSWQTSFDFIYRPKEPAS